MTRDELQAELHRVTLEIEQAPLVLFQIDEQRRKVALLLHRLEGRAELLRELLKAEDEEEP